MESAGLGMSSEHKKTILIVDDVEVNRAVLTDILEEKYNVLEAGNGLEAIEILKKNDAAISLMLLDIIMPEMSGFEVLALMQKNHWYETVPVVVISAESSSEYIRKGYEYGAVDYISRPFDPDIVLQRVENTIMLYSKQKELESLIEEQVREKEKSNTLMINILSTVVEFRNGESGLHVIRIRIITEILLEAMRQKYAEYEIDESMIAMVSNAAALHDIGKISIPEEILNKPGRLTKEEFEIMKTHSAIGGEMLDNLRFGNEEELVRYARQICRWHHEKWDGRGYPDGLKGEEIPIAAQVVSMADVYDALVSERVYKAAYSHEEAIQMILNGECGMFNPKLIECLLEEEKHLESAIRIRSGRPDQLFDTERLSREFIQKNGSRVSDRTLFLLEQERIKYQFLVSLSNEVMFEYDFKTDTATFSDRCEEEFGIPTIVAGVMARSSSHKCIRYEDIHKLYNLAKETTLLSPVFKTQVLLKKADGQEEWYELLGRSMWTNEGEGPEAYGVIGRISNIHIKTSMTKKLVEMAHRDSLTNLYNNVAAEEIVNRVLNGQSDKLSLIFLFDIDDFKSANDSYGHLFGDRVLKHVAQLVKNSIRKSDIVARVGGDEFLVFMDDVVSKEAVDNYCKMLYSVLKQQYGTYEYSISVGVAVYPIDGAGYSELFLHAKQALFASKRAGKGRYTYYDEQYSDIQSSLTPKDS